MLNSEFGTVRDVAGRACVETAEGRQGFALYGPYAFLDAGDYVVEFVLASVDDAQPSGRDRKVAVLDVAIEIGSVVLARKELFLSQLDGRRAFSLRFHLDKPNHVEFRVWVSGAAPLLLETSRRVIRIDADDDVQALLDLTRFPGEEAEAVPFFRDNRQMLRDLYEQGIGVSIRDGRLVIAVDGILLYVDSADDLNFVGEVLHENVYNFISRRPTSVIDVGMNIGLASLSFAAKEQVAEVFSFEPFRNTYDRAIGNLSLNSRLAAKITTFNHGLSNRDMDDLVEIGEAGDSGSASTVEVTGGRSVYLSLRDAGSFLAPLIAQARANGRDVVMKVDCEGSEFAIVESLVARNLLPEIRAFMVEWHAMLKGKSQQDLIAPLLDHGFMVFDRSPPAGNGFFYAVRLGD